MKKATIVRSDLPPEWSQVPISDPVGAEGDASRYAECVGRPDPKTVRRASHASDEFRLGDGMRVTSVARAMPNQAAAKADLAAQRGSRGVPCLRSDLLGAIDRRPVAGHAPQSVTVERLPGLDFGDETVAFRATLTYPPGDAGPNTTSVDIVGVRKESIEMEMTLTSAPLPFSADLERDLLRKVVGRV